MKCFNCIYYTESQMENECLAFDFYCFPSSRNECDLVDENFNLIKDDMGNECFESCENVFKRLKDGWRKIDMIKKYERSKHV